MAKTERIYNVPLRKGFTNVVRYRKAKKAVTTLKLFIKRHMKCSMDEIKIGPQLNLKLWEKGMKNPPHHVKVTAVKEDDVVKVELFGHKYPETEDKKEKDKGKKEQKTETKQEKEKPAEKKEENKTVKQEKKEETKGEEKEDKPKKIEIGKEKKKIETKSKKSPVKKKTKTKAAAPKKSAKKTSKKATKT